MLRIPRPQPSALPPLKRAPAIFSLIGIEWGLLRNSSGVVPGGKAPGFINSMRSSKMATLGVIDSDHQARWARRFRLASLITLIGTVSSFLLSKSSWSPERNICLRQKSSIACNCWKRLASTTAWSRNLSIMVPSNRARRTRQCEKKRRGSFPNSATVALVSPSSGVSTLKGRRRSRIVVASAATAGIRPVLMPPLIAPVRVLSSISFSDAYGHGVSSQLNFLGSLRRIRSSNISRGITDVVFSTL